MNSCFGIKSIVMPLLNKIINELVCTVSYHKMMEIQRFSIYLKSSIIIINVSNGKAILEIQWIKETRFA